MIKIDNYSDTSLKELRSDRSFGTQKESLREITMDSGKESYGDRGRLNFIILIEDQTLYSGKESMQDYTMNSGKEYIQEISMSSSKEVILEIDLDSDSDKEDAKERTLSKKVIKFSFLLYYRRLREGILDSKITWWFFKRIQRFK